MIIRKLTIPFLSRCKIEKKRLVANNCLCIPMSDDSNRLEDCLIDHMAEEERSVECSGCKGTTITASSRFRTLPK